MRLSERMVLGLESTKPTKMKYYVTVLKEWWLKINPFHYRIFLYNKHYGKNLESAAKIGYDGKYFFLLQDDGQPFRAQISMTIHDSVNKPTKAKIVTHVNIKEIIRIDKQYTEDIDQQLRHDKDIYGVAYERMNDGKRERIDPRTVRVHNVNREG